MDYLDSRIKDLPLEGVDERLKRYHFLLQKELRAKGISFDFHLWVSDEWFCPDGVPGFALPFYLFNKKLMKLHKQQMGLVEGTTERQILKLMRHELGHAIDNAFALRKNKRRQLMFGSSRTEYPICYSPRPYSKNYVHYLGDNYAQSHPDEDFAETFAYWLDPQKKWKQKKLSPVVHAKLQCMDGLMSSIVGKRQKLTNQFRVEPVDKNKQILKKFYKGLHKSKNRGAYQRIDRCLTRHFPQAKNLKKPQKKFQLNHDRLKTISRKHSREMNLHQYEVEKALKTLLERAQSLELIFNEQDFRAKAASLIQLNYRYLKENHLLKVYL